MEIAPLQRSVKAADLPLEKLVGNSHVSEADKVAEASRQFEAVLLRQVLADAQKPVFRSRYNQDSAATGIYRDMVTNQLAEAISHSRGLGLGNTLAKQLNRELKLDGTANRETSKTNANTD